MYNEDLRRGGYTNPERNYDDEPEKDLAMAVCSMVFGILGILTGIFGIGFDVAALVMGIVVLRRWYYGRGFAIAGIITSAVGFLSTIGLVIFIAVNGGELKDELIATVADYLYYYTDGGSFDDEEYDFDYDYDEAGDEYFDDGSYEDEEYETEEYDDTEDGDAEYYEDEADYEIDGGYEEAPDILDGSNPDYNEVFSEGDEYDDSADYEDSADDSEEYDDSEDDTEEEE